MSRLLLSLVAMICLTPIFSQNLMLEVFSGVNITAYEPESYSNNSTYFPVGFRVAGGLPNVQLGAEYHTDLKNASFDTADDLGNKVTNEFENSYYGAFVRANISPNPAYAFGIILKAGAGIYNTTENITVGNAKPSSNEFDGQLGFNGGIGFSLPIAEKLHLEAGYAFNFVKRETSTGPDYNTNHHSFQLGFSYNFLFGESARRYDSNKRWKNGWRSSAGKRYKNWGN